MSELAANPIHFAVLSFWSLFVIVDPITVIPAFLAMTGRDSRQEQVRMARIASIATFVVLLIFSLAGQWLLKAFGITMPAFQIAGGIVLLIVALDMLQARRTAIKETPEEQAEGVSKADIAVTPLAVPMLAGPGAMTAVVLLSGQAASPLHYGIVAFSILLVSVIVFLVLRLAIFQSWILSPITLKILARLMGLLLAAIAVQFVLDGIGDAIKFW